MVSRCTKDLTSTADVFLYSPSSVSTLRFQETESVRVREYAKISGQVSSVQLQPYDDATCSYLTIAGRGGGAFLTLFGVEVGMVVHVDLIESASWLSCLESFEGQQVCGYDHTDDYHAG